MADFDFAEDTKSILWLKVNLHGEADGISKLNYIEGIFT
jgi:hypothetical protein